MFAQLYRFEDAPKEWQDLSPYIGEEEYLIHVASTARVETDPFEFVAEQLSKSIGGEGNYSVHELHNCTIFIVIGGNRFISVDTLKT